MESLKDFFDGKKILITGGTGFLGRFLLAKLMRIGNLGEILVLARPKKQKTNTQRIDEALSGILFEKMDLYDPKFKSKIRIINGDIEVEGLGMLKDDRDYIQQEIHIIIHAAATVRFDESFNKAVNINVRGTRDLLDIAVDAKKLQRFIYVSTAYANCPRKKIDEVFYESPMYYKVAINLANKYPEEMLSHLSSKLIAPWPNTYTFTKAISEGMIKEYQTKLPLSIIRPGIVTMTYKDPMPGYVDNFSTLNGFGILKILGIIHVTYHRSRYFVNIVPVDMTVNLILAATRARTNEIYNCVWQVTKKIEDHKAIFLKDIRKNPVRQMIFYPSYSYTSSLIMFKFLMLLTSYLPAIMIDTILKFKGSSTRFVKIYNKVYYYQMLYHYFTAHWQFQIKNARRLFMELSEEDQKEFPCDVISDEFVDYIYNTNSSMRINYFKESEKDLIEARKKLKILKSSYHLILIAFYACLMYLIVRIMGKFFFM